MKVFSMFTGACGFELGFPESWETIGFSEIDKYASMVEKYHYPEVKNYGNARELIPEQLPYFDILTAGFPCQSFSIAGKRGGLEDSRGTLFYEIARVVRVKRPEFLLLENVRGLLSDDRGRTFGLILSTFSELGYICEWQVLNSKDFGVPQNRERVFIVGHSGEGCRQTVFPIGENDKENNDIQGQYTNSLKTRDSGTELQRSYVIESEQPAQKINVLNRRRTEEGKKARREAKKQGKDTTLFQAKEIYTEEKDIMNPITTGINVENLIQSTLTEATGNRAGSSKEYKRHVENVEKASGQIRRLTPLECERLMSWPDNWTKYGINDKGEKVEISDTQRYKMCGNGVVSRVVNEICKGIDRVRG